MILIPKNVQFGLWHIARPSHFVAASLPRIPIPNKRNGYLE
jgi:hypothetical protein